MTKFHKSKKKKYLPLPAAKTLVNLDIMPCILGLLGLETKNVFFVSKIRKLFHL